MNTSTSIIPGPRGHFLTGSLPEIKRDRLPFFLELMQNYGDVVQLRLGPVKAVMLYHPEAVQHVLQDRHATYNKDTRANAGLRPIIGNGLLISNGDFWLRQRRLMQPAFHRQRITAFGELMSRETLAMLDSWEPAINKRKAMNIQQEMMRLTLSIVTQALFGAKVTDADGTLGENIDILISDNMYRFEHPFYPPIWLPTGRNRLFTRARGKLDQVIYEMIANRRQHPEQGHDLLAMLMQAQYEGDEQDAHEGRTMSDQQLRDEVMTLFLAGHETTALALSWTLYLLSQNPHAEARLRKELDEVLQGRSPSLADLPNLTYTRMALDESMRLYPPAWVTERKSLQDDEIGGYPIPAGTTVVICPYVTHRHPQFWADPETFDPERFNPENANGRPRYAYFPFGGGPRQCIGNTFALLEAHLILATILQRYRLELAPGWQVQPDPLITLRPKGGLWMVVT
jgi:cytochrome P450